MFALRGGAMVPEFDRFGVFAWDAALGKVGKNLARLLRLELRGEFTARHAPHPLEGRGRGAHSRRAVAVAHPASQSLYL